jgi:hypothetical protein
MSARRAHAHGAAARAVLQWLHGHKVEPITMRAPSHDDDAAAVTSPSPRSEAEIREAIRIALAAPAGEMIHVGGDTRHIDLGRPEVERAALLACRLAGAGNPIDHLEQELDGVLAGLTSPRIWHAVRRLAASLCDHHSLSGATAATVIRSAVLSGTRAAIEPRPRGARIMPGGSPLSHPTRATRNLGRDDRSSSIAKHRTAK